MKKLSSAKKTQSNRIGINLDFKNSYEMGIYDKKTGDNNQTAVLLNNTVKPIAVGVGVGGAVKATTGQPLWKLMKRIAKNEPLRITKHLKDSGFAAAGKAFTKSVPIATNAITPFFEAGKALNKKVIAKNLLAGGATAAASAGVGISLLNKLKYEAGRAAVKDNKKGK